MKVIFQDGHLFGIPLKMLLMIISNSYRHASNISRSLVDN